MNENKSVPVSNLVSFDSWLEDIGKTSATGWRWRQRGWIEVLNISGRLYLSRAEIERFERRAADGQFSKVHQTPSRARSLAGKEPVR